MVILVCQDILALVLVDILDIAELVIQGTPVTAAVVFPVILVIQDIQGCQDTVALVYQDIQDIVDLGYRDIAGVEFQDTLGIAE